jgi:membrane fusion protein, copper/silver efflux system
MKTSNRLIVTLLFGSLLLGSVACSGSNETQTAATQTDKIALTDDVTSNVQRILDGYYAVKDAMVTSDATQVKTAAESLLEVITQFDTNGLEEAVAVRLTSEIDAIRYGAQNVAEAESIDAQREYLPALTENMIGLVTHYKVTEQAVYKQYCPMAFNDKGAYWLSNSDSVINPYFGDMMLRCGEVVESL